MKQLNLLLCPMSLVRYVQWVPLAASLYIHIPPLVPVLEPLRSPEALSLDKEDSKL